MPTENKELQNQNNEPTEQKEEKNTQQTQKEENQKNQEQKKYTDEDVDRIINKKFAKWQKEQQQAVEEAKKLEKMNKDEKTAYKIKQLEEEVEAYKQRETLSQMTKIAQNMLSEDGYHVTDKLLEKIVTQDAQTTKDNVIEFRDLIKKEIEKGINERLKGQSPKVKTTNTKQTSLKDLYKIKDPVKRRQEIMKMQL